MSNYVIISVQDTVLRTFPITNKTFYNKGAKAHLADFVLGLVVIVVLGIALAVFILLAGITAKSESYDYHFELKLDGLKFDIKHHDKT